MVARIFTPYSIMYEQYLTGVVEEAMPRPVVVEMHLHIRNSGSTLF